MTRFPYFVAQPFSRFRPNTRVTTRIHLGSSTPDLLMRSGYCIRCILIDYIKSLLIKVSGVLATPIQSPPRARPLPSSSPNTHFTVRGGSIEGVGGRQTACRVPGAEDACRHRNIARSMRPTQHVPRALETPILTSSRPSRSGADKQDRCSRCADRVGFRRSAHVQGPCSTLARRHGGLGNEIRRR